MINCSWAQNLAYFWNPRAHSYLLKFRLCFSSNWKHICSKFRRNMVGDGKMQMDIKNRIVIKAFYRKKSCWEFLVIICQYHFLMGCLFLKHTVVACEMFKDWFSWFWTPESPTWCSTSLCILISALQIFWFMAWM